MITLVLIFLLSNILVGFISAFIRKDDTKSEITECNMHRWVYDTGGKLKCFTCEVYAGNENE